jgi:hypothetical protein
MPQPPAYNRAFSFSDYTTNYPSTPQPGVRLDTEFNALATSINAIRTNLALIQRDDGFLASGSVGPDQISAALTIGLRSVRTWATGTAYVVNDAVWVSGHKLYRCLVAHTSAASFATDLAASRWTLVLDMSLYVQSAVNAAIAAGTINVGVDTSTFASLAGNNTFEGSNVFEGPTTFSTLPSTEIDTAETPADYGSWKPTDYGAGKPGVFLRKKAAADAWELELDDGAGGSGSLDVVVTAFTVNGATVPDQTSIDTEIRRARVLGLVAR